MVCPSELKSRHTLTLMSEPRRSSMYLTAARPFGLMTAHTRAHTHTAHRHGETRMHTYTHSTQTHTHTCSHTRGCQCHGDHERRTNQLHEAHAYMGVVAGGVGVDTRPTPHSFTAATRNSYASPEERPVMMVLLQSAPTSAQRTKPTTLFPPVNKHCKHSVLVSVAH